MSKISKDMTIADVISIAPQAASVIQKYFAGGCLDCPVRRMETLEMAAIMHGYNVDEIIAELERACQEP
jgi:hybrid cluster-associated redox disulfide protein